MTLYISNINTEWLTSPVRGYYDNCREAELSKLARDEESAAKLWQLSAAIVQLEQ